MNQAQNDFSMSATGLEVLIAELSTDIDRQKEVLKNLECRRYALQRQLNTIRDPVARLPFEISSEILTLCLPPLPPPPEAGHIPLLFLSTCSAWADIALSTPALWAAIHVELPRPPAFTRFLAQWLNRASHHPLSLSFQGEMDDSIAGVVNQHTEQLTRLSMYAGADGCLPLPRSIESFPSLVTLTIGCRLSDHNCRRFTSRQTINVLRLAPNLVECTLYNYGLKFSEQALQDQDKLVLPRLRYLRFSRRLEDASNHLDSNDQILKHLSLPSLETLYLPMRDISPSDITAFLTRSSPPLQKWVLGGSETYSSPPFTMLFDWLCLLPTLTHLELRLNWPEEQLTPLLTVLAIMVSPVATFLPILQTLIIRQRRRIIPDDFIGALVRTLTVRPHLERFELFLTLNGVEGMSGPTEHALAPLQRLVADGVRIHIGPEGRNYLSF